MSFHGRVSGTKVKRALGVQAALEWAFRIEQAQLELPLPPDITEEGFGFGLEYVLLQRAVLGCKIDGGQHKIGGYTHEDADVIAATLSNRRIPGLQRNLPRPWIGSEPRPDKAIWRGWTKALPPTTAGSNP